MRRTTLVLMLSVLWGVASNPLGDTEAMHAATRRETVLLAPIDCTTVITVTQHLLVLATAWHCGSFVGCTIAFGSGRG